MAVSADRVVTAVWAALAVVLMVLLHGCDTPLPAALLAGVP
jgi:hypothetical protein